MKFRIHALPASWSLTAFASALLLAGMASAADKPRIAIFSGPTATIQNNEPLLTSNKAREQYGLPLLRDEWGRVKMDWPRYQRLAAPVTVYIEMFTAHPLEADVKELYAAPDGYVNAKGEFSKTSTSPADKPVYAVTLKPEDGLYALPFMGRQVDGKPWDNTAAFPGAPFNQSRQTFVPDPSRILEEIERNGGNVYAKADYDFYRGVPAGGYTKGLPKEKRTDVGEGDIAPEKLGEDFFSYGPYAAGTTRPKLAQAVNRIQKALDTGKYAGVLWIEGSPSIEGTIYWLSLLLDTQLPVTANSAHRNRGSISPDGDGNIVSSIDFILSQVWADEKGRNMLGGVMVQDEIIYSGREIVKGDAHPGGYVATGGYGGVLGAMTAGANLSFVPTRKHTWKSEVRVTQLPSSVTGVLVKDGKPSSVAVTTKDQAGELVPNAIPKVTILKGDTWYDDAGEPNPKGEKGVNGAIDMLLEKYPLAGIVSEGTSPYASTSRSQDIALERAVLSGLPVVRVARGDAHGYVKLNPNNLFIEGSNAIATKARVLLTAALLKYGSLPPAADPAKPTPEELTAIKAKVKLYQELFNTH